MNVYSYNEWHFTYDLANDVLINDFFINIDMLAPSVLKCQNSKTARNFVEERLK